MRSVIWGAGLCSLLGASAPAEDPPDADRAVVVLQDDFSQYASGIWMGVVGAEAEYHYLPQVSPIEN